MVTNSFLKRAFLCASVCTTALTFGLARAETMDYGTLEQIFGEPVTTSATGQPQRVSDVPANMEIITQDDIRHSGADNIPDILRYYAGIDVETNAVNGSDVGIRGFNQPQNPHLLVLVDGREVYLDDYGWVNWGALPVSLNSIRQIEVVKGPNSALFGFNAVSGVINIITYDPLLDKVNSVTAAGGTQNLAETDGIGTVHLTPDVGVRVTGNVQRVSDFDATIGTPSYQAFADVAAKWRVQGDLILGAETTMGDNRAINAAPTGGAAGTATRTNSIRVTGEDETPIGNIAASVYRNGLVFTPESGNSWQNNKWVGQISDTQKIDANNVVRIAFEVRDNSLASHDIVAGTIGYRDFAPSAMWNWQITPDIAFTNAFRTDFLSLRRNSVLAPGLDFTNATYNAKRIVGFSYNSGLLYKVTENDKIRLMASRGLQIPSLINFGIDAGNEVVSLLGTPYVQPAVMTNYELDYDRNLAFVNGTASIGLFHTRLDNIIAGPFGTPTLRSGNFGYGLENGVELNLKGEAYKNIHYRLGYTFTSEKDHTVLEPTDSSVDGGAAYQHSTPRSVITAALGTSLGKWEFDGALHYQTQIQEAESSGAGLGALPLATIPSYVSTQLRVGYTPVKGVILAVSAQQALTPSLMETNVEKVGRRIIASVTTSF